MLHLGLSGINRSLVDVGTVRYEDQAHDRLPLLLIRLEITSADVSTWKS